MGLIDCTMPENRTVSAVGENTIGANGGTWKNSFQNYTVLHTTWHLIKVTDKI